MLPGIKHDTLLRLKSATGHLDSVRRMVEQDVYCVDLMKQVAAVQGALEGVQLLLLRNHLSTCVSEAVRSGMGDEIIDELLGALRYEKSLLNGHGGPASEGDGGDPAERTYVCTCHGGAVDTPV